MSNLCAVLVRKVGLNRGAPRFWLEGRKPAAAGFHPQTRFSAIKDEKLKKVTLKIDAFGSRMVSRKVVDEDVVPVIDINSAEVLAMFAGLEHVRVTVRNGVITIEPLESEQRSQERLHRVKEKMASGVALSVGSLSHGGGILSKAIHDGLALGGVKTKLSFANDIREDLLMHACENNPVWTNDTIMLAAPLQELAFDFDAMHSLPKVDILEAGLPCVGASVAGRAKNATSCAEEHPLVGHLIVAFIAVIARCNPAAICLENVPPYQSSASMHILRNQLRDFGYEVHETMVNSGEWGTLEHRKRMCMIAVTKGMDFTFDGLTPPKAGAPTVGDILDPVPLDHKSWSAMDYLFKKAERDAEAGKGFAMQILTEDATKVGTLGTGYAKCRGTEPKLQHPENPGLFRLFTPNEHARIKGIVNSLIKGLSNTVAHEVLGQSITPAPFLAIAELLAASFQKFAAPAEIGLIQHTVILSGMPVVNVRMEVESKVTEQASLF